MNIHIKSQGSSELTDRMINRIKDIRNCYDKYTLENINSEIDYRYRFDDIIIIIATDTCTLNSFTECREKFFSNKIIIIVNDDDTETISKAYLLKPIFIEFTDSDFSVITEIIKKVSANSLKVQHKAASS